MFKDLLKKITYLLIDANKKVQPPQKLGHIFVTVGPFFSFTNQSILIGLFNITVLDRNDKLHCHLAVLFRLHIYDPLI